MKNKKLQPNLGWLLSALCLLLTFQSCTKQEDLVALSASSQANATITQGLSTSPTPCKQVCLVAGQNMYVGNVGVSTGSNGDLLVTYNITKPNIYLLKTHLDIFTSVEQLKAAKKLSNGGATPGQFEFKRSWTAGNRVTSYTATIPKSYVDALGSDCFYVASHAALSNGETAWGGLCTESGSKASLDIAKQFPGKNWSVYFEFCKSDCAQTIDFTYAWEDQIFKGNDKDYNDLVIQSDLTKTPTELKINFLATARGAGYDHKFKFRIPKAGITGIFGDGTYTPTYTSDDTYYYITVFESTEEALPGGHANTPLGAPCVPFASRKVVMTLDNNFAYNKAKPYEPYISVYTSGSVNVGSSYDLYLYEVSGRDTWVDSDEKVYPNGILIPLDWRWPLEGVAVTIPYPNFAPITNGVFTTGWWNPLSDLSKTFDKNACQ